MLVAFEIAGAAVLLIGYALQHSVDHGPANVVGWTLIGLGALVATIAGCADALVRFWNRAS